MKHAWVFFFALLISLALGGCARTSNSGTNSAPASPSPAAAISSSADVVKVNATSVSIPAGGSADATVTLSISSGFHVNANPATYPYLIATEVKYTSDSDGCVNVGKPIYPAALHAKFAFAENPLAVYEGDAIVKVPITLPKAQKCAATYPAGAQLSLPLNVRVQACDHEQCFPPAVLNTTIAVEVE